MAVRILKVSGIAAPEGLACRLHEPRAGGDRLLHHSVDLLRAADVVTDRELGRAASGDGHSCVVRNVGAAKKRQLQATLEIEEYDCAMFELRADDAFRFQPQAIAVEAHCRFQIVDADCQYADSWFHVAAFKVR
ncbi:hypothetical protein WL11_14280 [Burkholderia ubonensis]|nr:hypothetical protein WL11_14280 [Burkholderia ubonensis]